MKKYLIRRVVEMLVTLYLIVTATFFILAAIPGNALTAKIIKLPETVQVKIMEKYGYDKPVLERYAVTMKNMVLKGEFGESIIRPGETFAKNLQTKLPVTIRLSIQQTVLGVVLGMLLGLIAAMKRGSLYDRLSLVFSMILVSMPSLVISLLLQKYCAGGKLPIIGWPKGDELWFGGWKYTILPSIAGACSFIAYYCRLTKTSMLESINQEYTLTARAKGLSEIQIVKNHVIRNSFIPIITVLPSTIASILTGSLFIERVFSIPGMGRYYVEAIQGRDIPIVLSGTAFYAVITVITMLVTDILYVVVDPRIKITGEK